jgi:hypothetical protein
MKLMEKGMLMYGSDMCSESTAGFLHGIVKVFGNSSHRGTFYMENTKSVTM